MKSKFNQLISRTLNVNLMLAFVFLSATIAFGQTSSTQTQTSSMTETKAMANTSPAPVKKVLVPVFKSYRDVTVGMKSADVKDKLGKAEVADKRGFFYKFSDDESAQIALGAGGKVRAISIMYSSKNDKAPTATEVFGSDVTITPAANGSIYKSVRYSSEGYAVIYSKGAAKNAMTIVTIQKL